MRISDWSSDVCSSDLPSMVRSAAISDSLAGASATARGGAAWVGLKSAAAGVSRIGVGVGVWAAWGFGAASLLANDGTSFLAALCWLKMAMEHIPRTGLTGWGERRDSHAGPFPLVSEARLVGQECVST